MTAETEKDKSKEKETKPAAAPEGTTPPATTTTPPLTNYTKPPAKTKVELTDTNEGSTQEQIIERLAALEKDNKAMAKVIAKTERKETGELLAQLPKKLQEKHKGADAEKLTDLIEAHKAGNPSFITNEQVEPSEPVKIKNNWNPIKQEYDYI